MSKNPHYRAGLMALSFALLPLATLVSRPAGADELMKWERIPLQIPLKVGQERVVFVDKNVRVGFPPALNGKLRVQSTGGAVYLKADSAFPQTRVQLQDVESGEVLLFDIADLKRADRAMIREALLMAAHATYKEGRQMLPSDLQKALYDIASDNDEGVINVRNAQRKAKAAEMAESLGMFTQAGSFEAELFNREGALWPEADVTLVDLGHLAREGYEAQMALTMVSMTNMINNIAERDQFLGRDIVFTVDEAHIVTVNPLLSPYMTKVVKMWRKLGAWLWLATQNLKDYPDIAEKMLNMAEWWICLTMPPEEVKDISRFRALTPEQESVLLSASKLSGCYTEGVVLAKRIEALFRAVPPSLFLALGMTEKEEKAERRALMNEFHCSELEAAKRVAQNLDRLRGLTEKQQEPATV